MQKLLTIILLLALSTFSLQADRGLKLKKMQEEQRVALVIGNANYEKLATLKNPINDARAMRRALQKRGFSVMYKENASKREMKKLIKKFTYKLKAGGVGLYYFAGHGVNVSGQNYLVATNSDLDSKSDVEYEAYALNRITKKMQNAKNRLNIVILDACRNDPFSRGSGGGLAPIGNAKGIFVAYATQAGAVAADGSGKNGVFTRRLIEEMSEKGATIERVFKNVRADVQRDTQGRQSPGVYNQIVGDFYFTLPDSSSSKKRSKRVKKSSFSFGDDAPQLYSLTINQTPSSARVSITNIKSKYYDGIALESGFYTIKVTKKGYYSKSGTVNLQNDLSINVTLKKKKLKDIVVINGLMWQMQIQNLPFKKAKEFCSKLSYRGYSDWHLPNIQELKTLKTKNITGYSGEKGLFVKPEMLDLMSKTKYNFPEFISSTLVGNSAYAVAVRFYKKKNSWANLVGSYESMCVRKDKTPY